MKKGIQFTTDGNSRRAQIIPYHCGEYGRGERPAPIFKVESEPCDIAGLKCREASSEIVNATGQAKFRIGFEIEKNSFSGKTGSGSRMTELALVQVFETDSTCGVEAVTHVLPLLPKSQWRSKVFNMFHEAERVISNDYSPTNYQCSTHTTLSVDGMDSDELMRKVRKYSGVIFALFRNRLANQYCIGNPHLIVGNTEWDRMRKYVVCRNRGFGIEFRLPSATASVRDLQLRYEIFYELINFSINHEGKSFGQFLKRVKPIIERMYSGDAEKVAKILDLSKRFQKFILTGKVCSTIRPILEGETISHRNRVSRAGHFSSQYTTECARAQRS